MANLLTIARVLLIFVIIAIWTRRGNVAVWWLDLLMVPLLAWAIFMDALDGWVASSSSRCGPSLRSVGTTPVRPSWRCGCPWR